MSVQNSEDKKLKKRSAFLDAARKIFSQKGFQAANVTDIVAEVKSGQGTFYYHFKDKQAIFDELIMMFLGALTEAIAENNRKGTGRLALVERDLAIDHARRIARVYVENRDLAELFFKESKYVGGEAAQRIELFYMMLFKEVENSIEEGKEKGLVRDGVDTRITARCFIGAVERAIFEAIKAGGPDDIDFMVAQIVDFQSHGVLAKSEKETF